MVKNGRKIYKQWCWLVGLHPSNKYLYTSLNIICMLNYQSLCSYIVSLFFHFQRLKFSQKHIYTHTHTHTNLFQVLTRFCCVRISLAEVTQRLDRFMTTRRMELPTTGLCSMSCLHWPHCEYFPPVRSF